MNEHIDEQPTSAGEHAAEMTPDDDSTPPHPSQAEGAPMGEGAGEGTQRPPRPSQAEGER